MKNNISFIKLTIILLLFINCNKSYGQNLTFQGAVLVDTNTLTVPAGEVWKIESIAYQTQDIWTTLNYSINSTSLASYIVINGTNIVSRYLAKQGNFDFWEIHLPIWLPAGATIQAGASLRSDGSISQNNGVKYISILKFSN
jgi:hypothetical protein